MLSVWRETDEEQCDGTLCEEDGQNVENIADVSDLEVWISIKLKQVAGEEDSLAEGQ